MKNNGTFFQSFKIWDFYHFILLIVHVISDHFDQVSPGPPTGIFFAMSSPGPHTEIFCLKGSLGSHIHPVAKVSPGPHGDYICLSEPRAPTEIIFAHVGSPGPH